MFINTLVGAGKFQGGRCYKSFDILKMGVNKVVDLGRGGRGLKKLTLVKGFLNVLAFKRALKIKLELKLK